MKDRKLVLMLILTGIVALTLIGFGSLLSNMRLAYINTEIPEVDRVIVDARRSVEDSINTLLPRRLNPDLPVNVERWMALDAINLEKGQTIILRDHRLRSIGDFLRTTLSLAFRVAGVVLIVVGVAFLFRQRFQIVEKTPPVEKA
jgi:hypothetical protein